MTGRWLVLAVAGAVSIAAACGGDTSPIAPTPVTLTAQVRAALERSIQDEYRAETIYQGVVNDLGPLVPFTNVLTAEQRHSASIAQLFTRRAMVAPASSWTLDSVPHFATAAAACVAAAAAERANISMYDELLRLDLPADVRQVFTNVRLASLERHLPAFERCW